MMDKLIMFGVNIEMGLKLLTILCLLPQIIYPGIIKVPKDYATIQAAIDISSNGDTAQVYQDTYPEFLNLNRMIILLGLFYLTAEDTSYISRALTNSNKQCGVLAFESGEDAITALPGFTMTNG